MLESNRRGMMVLYAMLALILLIVLATEAVSPPVGTVLLVGYLAFFALTAVGLPKLSNPQPRPLKRSAPRVSDAARKATDNAPRQSNLLQQPYILQDIGLIIDERRQDGIALRRARFISLDDESLRPYIVIHLPYDYPAHAVLVRFQMEDASGEPQFVYEMQYKLRTGENLIVPDYRLPLKDNRRLNRGGTWDIEVRLDNQIIGLYDFTMLPPLAERLRQSGTDGELHERLFIEDDEDMPMSLEELLKGR